MRRLAPLIAATVVVAPAAEAKPRPPAQRLPVVVELFTAQGCSDCPKADELIAHIGEQKGVITLTFSVDYWDYLGWKDTFAKPEFTERQQAYRTAFKLRDVYTPQIVLDGESELAGARPDAVESAVAEARKDRPWQPEIVFRADGRLEVGSGRAPRGGAVIWLVRYTPGVSEVKVKAGENKGETVRQANEVRELIRLGPWRGAPRLLRLPDASDADLESVVLVQAAHGGKILAARKLPSPRSRPPATSVDR
jgi:hypothetical protein